VARYVWPPLPILDRDEAARRMGEAMDSAWADLEAERLHVLESETLRRKRLVDEALRGFQEALDEFAADVAHHLDRFAELHLGPSYMEGVRQAGGQAAWNAIHSSAFVSLATDTYDDFLKQSQAAGRTSERFARAVRDASRKELPKLAGGGKTAKQAARELEKRLADDYAITSVRYANDARVSVRAYSEMVALTKSAVAYNSGTVNEAIAQGVEYMEVFDGAGCGWESHNSPDRASGSVRTVDECAEFPISHPRCRRAFGPRPDIRSKAEAKKASPTTTAEQRANTGTQTSADLAKVRKREQARERARAKREQRRTSTPEPTPAPAPVEPPVTPPAPTVDPAIRRQEMLAKLQREKGERQATFDRILADSKAKAAAREAEERAVIRERAELKAKQAQLDEMVADFQRREAASVGKGGVHDSLRREFDPIAGPESPAELVGKTNPLFQTDRAYQINCQNTAAAVEMRQRGLDVMARARTAATGRDGNAIAREWRRVGGLEDGATPQWRFATGADKLAELEAELPAGSRGFLIFSHPGAGGGSHIINWTKVKGSERAGVPDFVRYLDGQPGNLPDVALMMRNRKFKDDQVLLLRVDDCDVVDNSLMLERLTRRKTKAELDTENRPSGILGVEIKFN
jgi:hypothetical protein